MLGLQQGNLGTAVAAAEQVLEGGRRRTAVAAAEEEQVGRQAQGDEVGEQG